MSTRVLVIGLDGATFDVIDPLLAAGRLPNLACLREEGAFAPLQSTFPSHSAPAWTSCRTGVNPGKHGLFSWWRRQGYDWVLTTSADIQAPAVEQILSRRGRRVCTINVPMTYPPQPVNGSVVAGMPAPGPGSSLTYPANLYAELKAKVGEYLPDSGDKLDANTPSKALNELYKRHQTQCAAARYLLGREQWDYFMVVLTLTDKVQHRFWEFRERWQKGEVSSAVQQFGPAIDQCYEAVDEAVGLLLAEAGGEAHVLVVSDHGFGPCRYGVYPNVWLREQEYLCVRFAHKVWARQVHWARAQRWPVPYPQITIGPPRRRIAWNRTRAFGDLYVEPRGVYLNLKGRDPQGIISPGLDAERLIRDIADELLALQQPDGQPLLRHIYRPEDVYAGPFAADAGDLLLELQDDNSRLLGDFVGREIVRSRGEQQRSGSHRPVGILFARGRRVNGKTLPNPAHITDIAPTILQMLDEPAPSSMDGRPLFS